MVVGELGEAIAWVYGSTVLKNAAFFTNCATSRTSAARNSQGRRTRKRGSSSASRPAPSIKRKVPRNVRQRLAAFANSWRTRTPKTVATLEREILSRPLPIMRSTGWHASLFHHPLLRRTNVSCGASFAKCVALAVPQGLRWPSISGQTAQPSLVKANLVGDLSLALFRIPESQPLAMDTLSQNPRNINEL